MFMILGIGTDIVELERVHRISERQSKFVDRILTSNEKEKFETLSESRKIEFLAGRFAAKEAFSKAYGSGIGEELSFLHIEIASDEKGKPYICKPFEEGVHLSISHSLDYAIAMVVIEKK